MNRFWLKTSGVAVVSVLVVVIVVKVFWPAETKPATESKGTAQVVKDEKRGLQVESKTRRVVYDKPNRGLFLKQVQSGKLQTEPPDSNDDGYYSMEIDANSAYLKSLQGGARKRYYEPYRTASKRTSSQHPDINDFKIRERRLPPESQLDPKRRDPSREFSLHRLRNLRSERAAERVKSELQVPVKLEFSEEQIEQMHEKTIEQILEQYRDDPRAEKIREILQQQLKQYRKPRAAKEKKETSSK
jgi:hypothetical protein